MMNINWKSLGLRERQILIGGSVIIALILGYQFIFAPFSQTNNELRQGIEAKENLLDWMQEVKPTLLRLQMSTNEKPQIIPSKSLPSLIAQSLTKAKLSASKIEQTKAQKITINFSTVSFDGLIRWLISLHTQYNITVTECSIKALSNVGQVQANLTLEILS